MNALQHTRRLALHDGSIGFAVVLLIPGLVVGAALGAHYTGSPDVWSFVPLLVALVLVPLVNLAWRRPARRLPETVRRSAGWQRFYRGLLLLGAPAQLALVWAACWHWATGGVSWVGAVGWSLSVGLYSALFAINVGHELIHSPRRFDRAVGGLLLSTVAFGSFKVVHLRVHHRWVATPRDPASAPRDRSLFAHWWMSIAANAREAWREERRRQRAAGRPWWRTELLVWYGLTALWAATAWWLCGGQGLLFFALQCALAILTLELINYLQHYGLRRRVDAGGKYEPVQPRHSWSQAHRLTNLALLNMMRHGDHHANPGRKYQELYEAEESPRYPFDFSVMLLLAMVPPLFRAVVHPQLDRIQAGEGV